MFVTKLGHDRREEPKFDTVKQRNIYAEYIDMCEISIIAYLRVPREMLTRTIEHSEDYFAVPLSSVLEIEIISDYR